MTKVAILIDGGYFLKRLPAVRKDIDATDAQSVTKSVRQLIQGHLNKLNEVHKAPNFFRLLYRGFYYDARPYEGKGHTPVSQMAIERWRPIMDP